jgi:hypothetical protein
MGEILGGQAMSRRGDPVLTLVGTPRVLIAFSLLSAVSG